MPERIQMSRRRPWRAEHPDAVIVSRPTRWGNPARVVPTDAGWAVRVDNGGSVGTFPDDREARRFAVESYRVYLDAHPEVVAAARRELAGKDLACWCPLDQACHGDLLIAFANTTLEQVENAESIKALAEVFGVSPREMQDVMEDPRTWPSDEVIDHA